MSWRLTLQVALWLLVAFLVYAIIAITKYWGVGGWWDPGAWQIVAAIATWLLATGVGFAILQVRQARKSTNAQVAIELFKELRNYETVEKLRSIYNLKSEELKTLSSDKKKEIDYVLDRLDVLGTLVVNGIIDAKLAIETYGGYSALRCWYKLYADFIKVEQSNRGYYNENYEAFARLSLDYFKKAKIPIKLDGVDLVAELQKGELRPRSLKEIKRDRKTK